MSILRSLRAPEQRGADGRLPWGSSYIPTNAELGLMSAGVPVNESTALALATVFTCIDIIATAISTLPINVLTKTTDHTKVRIAEPPLVECPDPTITRQQWISQVIVSLLLRGNAYGIIASRDDMGFPSVIKLVHPDQMVPRQLPDGSKEYRLNGLIVPTRNVMHIPGLASPGSFIGLDPLQYMRGSWGLAAATEKYGGSFFSNSANPSGVIEHPGDLDPEETLELAREWKVAHQGIGNAQYPAVLTGGMTWKPVSISPENAQFILTRGYQAAEICAFFHVPEHLALGNADRTTSYGVGVESMELQFTTYGLSGWMYRIEQMFTDYTPANITTKFDMSQRIRPPTLERAQGYTLARNGGWLTLNEIRANEDMPPVVGDGGDDHWAPLNFAPVDSPVFQDPAIKSGGIGGGIENSPKAPPAPSSPDGS